MTHFYFKLIAAGALVLPAVTYLGYAGMKDGVVQYHLKVDDYLNDSHYRTQRVRLAGNVAEQGLNIGTGRLGAKFLLEGQTRNVPVNYTGVVPDLFKAGCEVIVEGRLGPDGTFQSDLVLTKCASKYESAGHGHGKEKRS
jgi:cytochrome c-type biogenesis protein CcmE